MNISELIARAKVEDEADAKRFAILNERLCMVCNTEGDDRRSLRIGCLYNLKEASPLFIHLPDDKSLFYLQICKGCRAMLLGHLAEWIRNGGRLADKHLDDDGISGYTIEEVKQGLAGPDLQSKASREEST